MSVNDRALLTRIATILSCSAASVATCGLQRQQKALAACPFRRLAPDDLLRSFEIGPTVDGHMRSEPREFTREPGVRGRTDDEGELSDEARAGQTHGLMRSVQTDTVLDLSRYFS